MAIKGIDEITGKTIERVIVKRKKGAPGYGFGMQVFLLFTDHTYYEIFSDWLIGFTGRVYEGGREEVLRYVSDAMEVEYEAYLDENGRPASFRPKSES